MFVKLDDQHKYNSFKSIVLDQCSTVIFLIKNKKGTVDGAEREQKKWTQLFLQHSKWDECSGEDVKGSVFMCFLSSCLLNWQVDDV